MTHLLIHGGFLEGVIGYYLIFEGRDCLYEQFVRGDHSPFKRRKYVASDPRIRRIVESYNERNIVEYFKGLSHKFLIKPWRADWIYILPKSPWPYKNGLLTGIGNFDVLRS